MRIPNVFAAATSDDPKALPARRPAALVFLAGALSSFAFHYFVRGPMIPFFVVTGGVLVLAAVAVLLRRTAWRPWAFASGWLLTPIVLFFLVLWSWGTLGDILHARSFDGEAWRAKHGAPYDDRTRLRMVEDLERSGRLDGLTHPAVSALLGEPDERPGSDDSEWVWRVGPSRGMPIDYTWLRVRFGPDGRVASYKVVED